MNIYLKLFIEFFKTGLFSLGGGLATIPFLYDMINNFNWFTNSDLMNMIAVSESTPGPMGVNMATYVGFQVTNSILGGIVATLGLITPSIIIIIIIAQFLERFKEAKFVQDAFKGIRPVVTALIASAAIGIFISTMFKNNIINYLHLLFFIILFIISRKYKNLHPITLIIICALIGIIFKL